MAWPGAAAFVGLLRSLTVYYGQPWKTARLRRLYASFLGPGDLAFDVGAHVGNRTRALLATGAEVVAMEPQALFHRFLECSLPRRHVTLLRSAVGAHEGMVTLAVSSAHPTVSTTSSDWRQRVAEGKSFEKVAWDKSETVPCTTLDALIVQFGLPRFVKLDVEGAEAEILSGLSHAVPWLAFEYLPDALEAAHTCLNRLTRLGSYRCNIIKGEAAHFQWAEWLTPEAAWERLEGGTEDGRHGDIYARLDDTQTAGSETMSIAQTAALRRAEAR